MPKYILTIDEPGDRSDLPWRVTFKRIGLPDTSEYRTMGTRASVEVGAKRILHRLETTREIMHLSL